MQTTYDLKKMNKQISNDVKRDGTSYGMRLLISAIKHTQRKRHKTDRRLTIYMKYVTPQRLQAFVIHDGALHRLCIPEAGHRLCADYKDGYQFGGGGYSREVALLDRLHHEVSKHMNITLRSQRELTYESI